MSSQQLTLNINLRDGFRFDSYYVQPDSPNFEAVEVLKSFVDSTESQQNIIWGEQQSGKTHLLQACCAREAEAGRSVNYLPLKMFESYGVDVLRGLTNSQLIVVDDVDSAVGEKDKREWEIALFNLINSTRENGQRLLLSSRQNPRNLHCLFPDLASRLIWGGSYQVHELSAEDKPRALQARAEQRGFKLTDRVIEYLYRRYPRDIESLMDILNTLDEESLRQKTVITVPFVKKTLG